VSDKTLQRLPMVGRVLPTFAIDIYQSGVVLLFTHLPLRGQCRVWSKKRTHRLPVSLRGRLPLEHLKLARHYRSQYVMVKQKTFFLCLQGFVLNADQA